jgi:hypothetical protein
VWLLVVLALLVLKFLVLLHKATQSEGKQQTVNTAFSKKTFCTGCNQPLRCAAALVTRTFSPGYAEGDFAVHAAAAVQRQRRAE